MDTNDKSRKDREALLARTKEAKECIKEEIRKIKRAEARRKRATRVFLTVLTLLTVAVHYLYFSSPGRVVVDRNGEIQGLANKTRAFLQGKRFWRDQLHEVTREIRWDDSGMPPNVVNGRTSGETDWDADREMESYYRRYPKWRSSLAELYAKVERGRITQVEWMAFNRLLEELRKNRSHELQGILPVVRSKAG